MAFASENEYDWIIAGGGGGGLSMLFHLLHSTYRNDRILVIDKEKKTKNDRTWCFWESGEGDFDHIATRIWNRLAFRSDHMESLAELTDLRYKCLQGIDFYRHVYQLADKQPNVTFYYDEIRKIESTNEAAEVVTTNERFRSKRVVNSSIKFNSGERDPVNLYQTFLGWKLEAPGKFDPDTPVLMDFDYPDQSVPGFFYILPFSADNALVEFTQFRPQPEIAENSEMALKDYLQRKLEITDYRIMEVERGIVPMTDQRFSTRSGNYIYHLGQAGGNTKPTTGYTFLNMQRRCKEIISDRKLKNDLPRYYFYDQLLLRIMLNEPEKIKPIMERLFQSSSMEFILRFLAEETPFWSELRMLAQLPWAPFLRAFLKLNAGK